MTSQIGILNKKAVVLATDSAVTISGKDGEKIYNSVNKVFSFSKTKPIAIMVYGSADLLGIPWEVISKVYRKKTSNNFPTLEGYADHFVKWIADSSNGIFSTEIQEECLRNRFQIYFKEFIVDPIESYIDELLKTGTEASTIDPILLLDRKIDEIYAHFDSLPFLHGFDESSVISFLEQHRSLIQEITTASFPHISDTQKINKIYEIAVFCVTKNVFLLKKTGLVFAGFGDDDLFPSLIEYSSIDGVFDNTIRSQGKENTNVKNNHSDNAHIKSFAQDDVIENFLFGIHPDNFEYFRKTWDNYPDFITSTIQEINIDIPEDKKQELISRIKDKSASISNLFLQHAAGIFSTPIVRMVASMPVTQMCELAESLINLTSLKKKVTITSESVGGETEVLSITKGEGLIWIKRKHYFDPNLNPAFVKNYLNI